MDLKATHAAGSISCSDRLWDCKFFGWAAPYRWTAMVGIFAVAVIDEWLQVGIFIFDSELI
jgi:hypothetical protein